MGKTSFEVPSSFKEGYRSLSFSHAEAGEGAQKVTILVRIGPNKQSMV